MTGEPANKRDEVMAMLPPPAAPAPVERHPMGSRGGY